MYTYCSPVAYLQKKRNKIKYSLHYLSLKHEAKIKRHQTYTEHK